MQHLDEGMIHSWLDGALSPDEARAVEAHVAECATCAESVAEARGLIAASSRILTALDDVPAGVIPATAAEPTTEPTESHTVAAAGAGTDTPGDGPPPLIDELALRREIARRREEHQTYVRRRVRAGNRWVVLNAAAAAVVLFAVGSYALRRGGAMRAFEDRATAAATSTPAESDGSRPQADVAATPPAAPAPSAAPTPGDAQGRGVQGSASSTAPTGDRAQGQVGGVQGRRDPAFQLVDPRSNVADEKRAAERQSQRSMTFRADTVAPRRELAAADSFVARPRNEVREQEAADRAVAQKVAPNVATAKKEASKTDVDRAAEVAPAKVKAVDSASQERIRGALAQRARDLDSSRLRRASPSLEQVAPGARAAPPQAAPAPPASLRLSALAAVGCYSLGITPLGNQADPTVRAAFNDIPRAIALDSTLAPQRSDGVWMYARDITGSPRQTATSTLWKSDATGTLEVSWTFPGRTIRLRLTQAGTGLLRGTLEQIDANGAVLYSASAVGTRASCGGR